jgi:hypothetical protein
MASKVQERIYAEKAAALLSADWLLVEIPEPLDFEVRSGAETFGLEVRQIFVDVEADFGSPAKRDESKNRRAISALTKRYYEACGPTISAKFLGELPDDTDDLVESMVSNAPLYAEHSKTIEVSGMKVFMTPLPVSFPNYSRWTFVNDKVGWLRRVTTADLQHAINKKEGNLALYKKKCDKIELLLVADRTFNSGKLIEADKPEVTNPGFRAIYFMSYPESIERIG